ncbi:winged helix-turn-helix transcriptional regulator [Granulicella arctica]|uniref:winged helix-turn-helix transcriptional regulator n=1 Tax=Granulicella arctica TaxID=940613 RepID=UPI0021E0FBC8|nr:helix-turn-helix domain-containing protein [Granulicella arctica]
MSETNISVPDGSLSPTDCKGLADVLASVGDKWTIMAVGALSKGSLRYNEIQRRVSGISQRMLTMTLKRLEADGIVTRTLFPSVPPRVDYELTELGQTLRGALMPLHVWAAKNKQTIALNRLHSVGTRKNPGHPLRSDEMAGANYSLSNRSTHVP